jgi:hypothetical protein
MLMVFRKNCWKNKQNLSQAAFVAYFFSLTQIPGLV